MSTRELSSPPSLTRLYPRAVAGAGRSVLGRLPGLGRDGHELPDSELALPEVEIDRAHVADYCRACGFRLRDELPLTYPHLIAFPLSMQLMTDSDFPFPVIGLVHVENRIEQQRPLRADERPAVRVWTEGPRPHDKGTQFDVRAQASVDGTPVWDSTSTYLRREGGGGSGGGSDSGKGKREDAEPPRPGAIWEVPGDIGRRYAAVSGDRNPIHLHPISARLFGMPKPIAHGMWLKARCLAALEGVLPPRCTVQVRFKLPVQLPARVAFSSHAAGEGREFGLHDARSGKPHLTGTVR